MLRVSMKQTERDIDIHVINGESDGVADVPFANELTGFAEAVASFDEDSLGIARAKLLDAAGPEVLVDAAGVAGNFQRMVRIADSTGIPLDERNVALSHGMLKDLDLRRFESARNTPPVGLKLKLLSLLAGPMVKRMVNKLRAREGRAG